VIRKLHQVLRHVLSGHFYLTKLLLPVLTETAKKAPAKTVRVINVSSIGHYLGAEEGIRWSTLTPGDQMAEERKKLGSIRLFGQSKLVKHTSPHRYHPFLMDNREISSFQTSLPVATVVKASCPSPSIQERTSRVMQVHSWTVLSNWQNWLSNT
jgi:hypothetical protein